MKTRLGTLLVFLFLAGFGFMSQDLNAQSYKVDRWVIAGGGVGMPRMMQVQMLEQVIMYVKCL